MTSLLLSSLGLLAMSPSSTLLGCSTTYTTGVNGVTGLYNASDVQTASNVSINSIQYKLDYDVTHSTPGTYPFYYYFNAGWTTTIKVNFTNTNWQTAPAGSKFWVQVCNYFTEYDAPSNTSTVSSEIDYFQLPGTYPNPLVWLSGGAYAKKTSFADVNPKEFDIASLSVDPSDLSGKTGVIVYTIPANVWDDVPSSVTTTHYANGSGTGWFGTVWGFARPSGTGGCSIGPRGITYGYAVPAEESPLLASLNLKR